MAKLSLNLDVAPVNLATLTPTLITKQSFVRLCEEYAETCAKFSQIEAKKKQLGAELKDKWHAKLGPKLETSDFLCTQVFSYNNYLTAEVLTKVGVSATQIEKAKALAKKPYSYPKVTRKKDVLNAGEQLKDAVCGGRA